MRPQPRWSLWPRGDEPPSPDAPDRPDRRPSADGTSHAATPKYKVCRDRRSSPLIFASPELQEAAEALGPVLHPVGCGEKPGRAGQGERLRRRGAHSQGARADPHLERPRPPRKAGHAAEREGRYKTYVGRLVKRYKAKGVKAGASRTSQPQVPRDLEQPAASGEYLPLPRMRSMCRTCRVVALDVLDQAGATATSPAGTRRSVAATARRPGSSASTTTPTPTAIARVVRARSSGRSRRTTAGRTSG